MNYAPQVYPQTQSSGKTVSWLPFSALSLIALIICSVWLSYRPRRRVRHYFKERRVLLLQRGKSGAGQRKNEGVFKAFNFRFWSEGSNRVNNYYVNCTRPYKRFTVGGVPRGRILEIYGPESSGKTTVALHIIAETQKAGAIPVVAMLISQFPLFISPSAISPAVCRETAPNWYCND